MTIAPSLEIFAFDAPLRAVLQRAGLTRPNDVQQKTWPSLLQGRDVLLTAQTGSGKTLTYLSALLHHLLQAPSEGPARPMRALILVPTRELALQVASILRPLSRPFGLKSLVVIGGEDKLRQDRKLSAGVDIIIATPGRLQDFLSEGKVSLSALKFFVIDEVDRLLDEGFAEVVIDIAEVRNPAAQVVLCSATFQRSLKQIIPALLRKNYAKIEVKPDATVPRQISQNVIFAQGSARDDRLCTLIENEPKRVIVFVNVIAETSRLAARLQKHAISAGILHGDMKQSSREKALASFRHGRCNVLVTTDVAARGLDIDGIALVINYDLPRDAETYVHRIGRTARAGVRGRAVSFCSVKERFLLRDIERGAQVRLKVVE